MNEEKYSFNKSESWWMKTESFSIEVKHWYTKGRMDNQFNFHAEELSHKWNVYVYVFPKHPSFDKLTDSISPLLGDDENYEILDSLHYGCTYCHWGYDKDGKVISKQYGSDYAHLHDDHFEGCDSKDHPYAREIFFDAERLYDSFISDVKIKEA